MDLAEKTKAASPTPGTQKSLFPFLLDAVDIPIAYIDTTDCYQYANHAYKTFFGLNTEDITGKSVLVIAGKDAMVHLQPHITKALNGEKVRVTANVPFKHGTYHVEIIYTPFTDEEGYSRGYIETINPIHQHTIEEGNGRLAAIVQSSDDAIISKTLNSIITSWNAGAQKLFGYTAEEMIGQSILKIIPPDRIDEEPLILERLKRGERVEHFETKRLAKSGKLIDISLTISPVKDSHGNIIGASKIARDIGEQKLLNDKVRDSELLFKTISNASPAGLWMTDADGQNVFVNDTWIKWTGISTDQQMMEGWAAAVVEQDRNTVFKKFKEASEKKEYFNAGFRFLRTDGEIRWGLTEGYPYYDSNENFAGYAGSVTDITDIKKLEQRKDDFIKMASHELKTPITSINGYVQLLLNIYNETDDEKLEASKATVKSSLNTVAKQVAKLTRLISELLDLAKIESGKLEMNKTRFNLSSLIDETVQDIRLISAKHAIIVDNNFKGSIYGDKDRIGQVLTNILNNAIKYSPEANRIEVNIQGKEDAVTISIKDFGIGIDKSEHDKIFLRFYRAEGKTEQTFPGFGIGLFIASEIIQRHNGTIGVKSEKGKGAEFIITLPIEK